MRDLEILALSQPLCAPVGGAQPSFTVNSTLAGPTGPTPQAFTGGAGRERLGFLMVVFEVVGLALLNL